MMLSTHRDIIQSNTMTVEVGVHAAIIFREELRENIKDTAKYCSVIRRAKSTKKVSTEEQHDGLKISARNSVRESLHRASTDLL